MIVLLVFLVSGALLELGLHIPGWPWRMRKFFSVVALICTALGFGILAGWAPNVFSGLLLFFALYRLVNCMRIVEGRMHEDYLRHATLRTFFTLAGLQIATALAWAAWHVWHTTGYTTWTFLAATQLLVAIVLLAATLRTIKRTSWPSRSKSYTDVQLPTISVAIPARDETYDLMECLESLIASDYPKLEILVLDDNSQTKRTPEIIRSFAHDGVRFVKGAELSPTWLAKNQAYSRLAHEASGEYILFCGVDVRFAPDSLRKLVDLMLTRRKLMISVLPRRARSAYSATSLIQAMRYWWELVPPRRQLHRPPVLSTCWIIKRSALHGAGGFRAVAHSIVPEAYFARQTARVVDGYSFLRAGEGLGIESVKKAAEQRNTAVRMRYPQVHRRPEQVAIHSLLEFYFLLAPFALALAGFWLDIGLAAQVVAALAGLCLVVAYELVVLSTHVNSWWFGLIAPPFMVLADIALLHYSMWKYEFSEVQWKGRDITTPAMHVVPHLPRV